MNLTAWNLEKSQMTKHGVVWLNKRGHKLGYRQQSLLLAARKCINVHCHEEKRNMKKEITLLKQEIEDCKYPLSP